MPSDLRTLLRRYERAQGSADTAGARARKESGARMKVYLVIDKYDHEVGVTVFARPEDAGALFESLVRSEYRFGPNVDTEVDETSDAEYTPWNGSHAEAWDGVAGWSIEVYGAEVE